MDCDGDDPTVCTVCASAQRVDAVSGECEGVCHDIYLELWGPCSLKSN